YVMNNYWFTNYKAGQDGRITFRYSITSAEAIEPAAATLFGSSVQQPIRAIYIPPRQNAMELSGFSCEVGLGAELSSAKPAEDGTGIIMRVHETSGQAHDVTLKPAGAKLNHAEVCDLVERPISRIDINAITLKL